MVRESERSQVNNLAFYINKLEKEEQTKPKATRWKAIIKIREKLMVEKRKIIEKIINKIKFWFLENINKINKPSSRRMKEKREKTQINKTENENRVMTTNLIEIKRTIREYYEQLYANK